MASLERILDLLTAAILAALLLFMPAAFGAVEAWSGAVVVTVLAILSLLAALQLLRPRRTFTWSWAYLPIAGFLLWVALQLLPLPAGVVAAISPQTAETRRTLLAFLPNAADLLRRFPLSLHPWATRHDLRTILCAAAVFTIIVQIARTPGRIRFLLGAMAAAGGIIAALTLAQDFTRAHKLYWTIPGDDGAFHSLSGPFINHSHYGQFMNLSMGAGLALLLPLLAGKKVSGRTGPAMLLAIPQAALILLGGVTIIWSHTRGGVLSMAIAAVAMAALLALRRGIRAHRPLLAGLILVALCGGGTFVYFLQHGMTAGADGRFQLLKDALSAWRSYPVTGIGLGAHENVFPLFDSDVNNYAVATHVENEYAQVLEETGAVGLAMMLLFLAIIARQWWIAAAPPDKAGIEAGARADLAGSVSTLHRDMAVSAMLETWPKNDHKKQSVSIHVPPSTGGTPVSRPGIEEVPDLAVFGLGYGLVAVMVHSCTDFGQHLPANACLTAATCGLIVALARLRSMPDLKSQISNLKSQIPDPSPSFRPLRFAWLFAVLAVGTWAVTGALAAARAEAHWDRAQAKETKLRSRGWKGPASDYSALIAEVSAAVSSEPDNITYRYWLASYLWSSATPGGGVMGETPMPSKPRVAASAAAMLEEAIPLSPTFGPAHALLGQLQYFTLGRRGGAAELELGYRLAGYDIDVCLAAGMMAARSGREADAIERFRHALRIEPEGASDRIIAIVFRKMRRPRLAVEALRINYYGLVQLLHDLEAHPQPLDLVAEGRALLDAAIKDRFAAPEAPVYALSCLGSRYFDEGNFEQSLALYRRCSALEPREIGYSLAIAQCLQKLGRGPEAADVLRSVGRGK